MLSADTDFVTPIVARVLQIEDVTWGATRESLPGSAAGRAPGAQASYIVRYRGRLYSEDTAGAYDLLAEALRAMEITPIFRLEDGRHVVILVRGVIRPKPSNPWVNLVLFILTVFSVLFAGALSASEVAPDASLSQMLWEVLRNLDSGLPFAASLMAILLAHEFGHYLVGRYHKTAVTLPYYIPFPLSAFGTMGAFIQLKEFPRNRRILLDIGMAGPLAGLVVAIPVLILGLALSTVEPLPQVVPAGLAFTLEGNSILYLGLKWLVKGALLPAPASYGDLSPLAYWLVYFFTGQPIPLGGYDVMLHPVAWAGWAGLLVTSLNLIPAGQLDGGHVLYVLFGRRASKFVPFILGALVLMGLFWSGWWLWAFLIFIFGRMYAEPLDLITPLDGKRKAMAVLMLVIFVLVFMPVPLTQISGALLR